MKKLSGLFLLMAIFSGCRAQDNNFKAEPVPSASGFRMDGYWVWCGSVIKAGPKYHMFASRWKKTKMFPEDYRNDSEIVRATSDSPLGPFEFSEVVIGQRDSSYWDSNMAHNPVIFKWGDEYVLFYIGSDYTTFRPGSGNLIRRVGYAVARNIEGPWHRSEKPLIDVESNNPAVIQNSGKFCLMYRDQDLRVFFAESDTYKGPFKMINDNVWPESKIEDFSLYAIDNTLHMICEDNAGSISGHERWGVHLFSEDNGQSWKKYDPVIVYDHSIAYSDNSVLMCTRRERPQLLVENGAITHLITAVFDGKDSWSQPVKLATPLDLSNTISCRRNLRDR